MRKINVAVTHFENVRTVEVLVGPQGSPQHVTHVEVPDMDNPSRTETVEVEMPDLPTHG